MAEGLQTPPIAFAHRGARTLAPDNTLGAFTLAVELGATGIESDAWLTADGVPVLAHDGRVRSGLRRRPIRSMQAAQLPAPVPTMAQLYEAVGCDLHVSVDVKDPAAAAPLSRLPGTPAVTARCAASGSAPPTGVRPRRGELSPTVRLVDSTRLRQVKEGVEKRAALLAAAGVDALNLHHTDWSPGLTTLVHRFGVHAFAWDCQFERVVAKMLAAGVDGVYSDDVEQMMAAVTAWTR